MEQHTLRNVLIILSALVLVFVAAGGFALYHGLTRTSVGLIVAGDRVGSATLVNNLGSRDPDLVMTSLSLLAERSDPAGAEPARGLLASNDDYIWFNAALYLAAIGDPESVPYLIKGLSHTAHRSRPEVAAHLQMLTGQSLGEDQEQWIDWWKDQNPHSEFSFRYERIDRQTAALRSGSTVRINHVIDPVTISHMGSPIRLIGIRLTDEADPAAAKQLLLAAVQHQFVHLEVDAVSGWSDDGARQAMAYWVPDPGGDAQTSSFARRGLPPVPFAQPTLLQAYLIRAGLYELDAETVHDKRLLDRLVDELSGEAGG